MCRSLLGDGAGNFSSVSNYGIQYYGISIQLADTDLDGDLDAVLPLEPVDKFAIAVNNATRFTGESTYGTGTYGSSGILSLTTNSLPQIGNSTFAIMASNMPKSTAGVVLICDAQDLAGTDYFGIGLKIHVNPIVGLEYYGLDVLSDASGAASPRWWRSPTYRSWWASPTTRRSSASRSRRTDSRRPLDRFRWCRRRD